MKYIFILLGVSILLLNIIFITADHSFLALYYVLWLGVVGRYFWKHRQLIEERLVNIQLSPATKFLGLGLLMILAEETLAGFSMHLGAADSLKDMLVGILQFYAFNFLALPGMVLGWFFLLRRYHYERRESFVLIGLFGLFAEKTLFHVMSNPIMGVLLLLPTMFTYMLIFAPSIMSYRNEEAVTISKVKRYALGLIVPFLCSIPFVLLLTFLKASYPDFFPPQGFVG